MATGATENRLVLSLLTFFLFAGSSIAANATETQPPVVDPFTDPKDDVHNPLRYIPSNTLTTIAYTIVLFIAVVQTYLTFRYKPKWMSALVIGEWAYACGFGVRFLLHWKPDSLGVYIAEDMLIVLSPCAFIAADYVLLGRLARHLDRTHHVLLPAHRLTQIFVTSDVTTFLMQAAGGGLMVIRSTTIAEAGTHLFLAGLILQLVSFVVFCTIYAVFMYRIYATDKELWNRDAGEPWYRDWRALAGALSVSCLGILVRSGYRVAELSEGYTGHLSTTEWYFYAFDTLPLVVAISIYVPFWPGRFIGGRASIPGKKAARTLGRWFGFGGAKGDKTEEEEGEGVPLSTMPVRRSGSRSGSGSSRGHEQEAISVRSR